MKRFPELPPPSLDVRQSWPLPLIKAFPREVDMIRQATWCLALLALFVPWAARAQPVLSSVDYTAAGNGLLTYDPVSGLFAPWTAYAQPVLSSVDPTVAGSGLLTYDPVSGRFDPWTAYAQPLLSSVDLTVAGDGLLTYDPVSERFWLDQGPGERKDGVTIGNTPPR